MRVRTVLGTALGALCFALVGQPVLAQSNNIARIYFLTPKQGMGPQFEAALAEHAEWRRQNNDPWTWIIHEVENGDDLGMFIARSGDHTWADLDAYESGFGPRGSEHFFATVGPYMESARSTIGAVDTTNVRWPENARDVNLLQITVYNLKPNQGQRFFEAVGQIHKAIIQTNYPVHYAFESVVNGGRSGRIVLVLPRKNWADFQGPQQPMAAMLAGVYGQEKVPQIFEDFASTYETAESMILRVRWDLSVMSQGGM